jgi:hypothetical protein
MPPITSNGAHDEFCLPLSQESGDVARGWLFLKASMQEY